MQCVHREQIKKEILPGRAIQKAIGRDSALPSEKMTVGFGHYSAETGPMQPHRHAEETVYVLDARDAYLLYGASEAQLDQRLEMTPGSVFLVGEMEWHVFRYGEGGFVDAIFIYGQVDNIRPEEIAARQQ